MSHTNARIAMNVCSIASVVCCLVGYLSQGVNEVLTLIFLGLAVALLIGTYVIHLLYWRCPHCGEHLPTRGVGNMEYCPYCGGML